MYAGMGIYKINPPAISLCYDYYMDGSVYVLSIIPYATRQLFETNNPSFNNYDVVHSGTVVWTTASTKSLYFVYGQISGKSLISNFTLTDAGDLCRPIITALRL